MSQTIYSAAQSRVLDLAARDDLPISGYGLMCRAGAAAFDVLCQRWPDAGRILVLCGGGNNGGDGWVVARLAQQAGLAVLVVSVVEPSSLRDEAAAAYRDACDAGVMLLPREGLDSFEADVVVDALLGTGFSGEPRPEVAALINWLKAASRPVFALDIPSGVAADADTAPTCAVRATLTLAFIAWKPAHWTGPGRVLCGERRLATLGVGESTYRRCEGLAQCLSLDGLAPMAPRAEAAHKGHFGHVVAVGGDHGTGGAIVLAARAAQRSGAGLVSVVTRPAHVPALLAQAPEIMTHGTDAATRLAPLMGDKFTLLVGPGMGQEVWGQAMLQRVLQAKPRAVLDADALNLVARWGVKRLRELPLCVISPHPGEAARLLHCPVADIEADRLGAARRLQRESGAVVVLKGQGTIVDDGHTVVICQHGNPGMASGGMGDVLSGIIAALLAQGLSGGDAARRAVAVHSAAADRCAEAMGQRGMAASDLIPIVRTLLNG